MENMDKVLTVSAKNTPNVPNFSAQIVCPSPKVWDFDEKRLHWASVVRDPWCLPTQNWLKIATNDISIQEFHNVMSQYTPH